MRHIIIIPTNLPPLGLLAMPLTEPWSKQHKRVTRASAGGLPFSLSNSFAQPLTHPELVALTRARGDHALLAAYDSHALGYTPNGGSLDLREEIAQLYGPNIGAENVLVFPGAQVGRAAVSLRKERRSAAGRHFPAIIRLRFPCPPPPRPYSARSRCRRRRSR